MSRKQRENKNTCQIHQRDSSTCCRLNTDHKEAPSSQEGIKMLIRTQFFTEWAKQRTEVKETCQRNEKRSHLEKLTDRFVSIAGTELPAEKNMIIVILFTDEISKVICAKGEKERSLFHSHDQKRPRSSRRRSRSDVTTRRYSHCNDHCCKKSSLKT